MLLVGRTTICSGPLIRLMAHSTTSGTTRFRVRLSAIRTRGTHLQLRADLIARLDVGDAGPFEAAAGLAGLDAVDGEVAEEVAGLAVDHVEHHALADVVGGADGDRGVVDAVDVAAVTDDAVDGDLVGVGGRGRPGDLLPARRAGAAAGDLVPQLFDLLVGVLELAG